MKNTQIQEHCRFSYVEDPQSSQSFFCATMVSRDADLSGLGRDLGGVAEGGTARPRPHLCGGGRAMPPLPWRGQKDGVFLSHLRYQERMLPILYLDN